MDVNLQDVNQYTLVNLDHLESPFFSVLCFVCKFRQQKCSATLQLLTIHMEISVWLLGNLNVFICVTKDISKRLWQYYRVNWPVSWLFATVYVLFNGRNSFFMAVETDVTNWMRRNRGEIVVGSLNKHCQTILF